MNNKMAKMHIYQQLNLKNKLSKLKEQRQKHAFGEHFDGCQIGEGCRGLGENVRELRNTSR